MDLETMQKAEYEVWALEEALFNTIKAHRYAVDTSSEEFARNLAAAVLHEAQWVPSGNMYRAKLEGQIERYLSKTTLDGGPPFLAENLARYLTR